MDSKRVVIAIVAVLLLWCALFAVDFAAVSVIESPPVFCMKSERHHYTGLGYSFDAYENPLKEDFEYCLYFFGKPVKSTITN